MEPTNPDFARFEVGAHDMPAYELSGRTWRYLKKLHDQKEHAFEEERQALLKTMARSSDTVDELAVALGLISYEASRLSGQAEKRGEDTNALSHLQTRFDLVLKRLGVIVEDPAGAALQGVLADCCDVIDNVEQPGVQGHLVGETISPIVIYRGKVVHRAEVIGWMGVEAGHHGAAPQEHPHES